MKATQQLVLMAMTWILLAAGVSAQDGQASSRAARESNYLITLEVVADCGSPVTVRIRDGEQARVSKSTESLGISPLAHADGEFVDLVITAIDRRGEDKETLRQLDRMTDLAIGEWRESEAVDLRVRVVEIGRRSP